MAVHKHRKAIVGASLGLAFLLVPLLAYLHQAHVVCLANPFGATTVEATFVDGQGHRIPDVFICVFDPAHNGLEEENENVSSSGSDGEISEDVPTKYCY